MNVQQKNKPEGLADRELRISRIAGFTQIALEAMTMTELRELGAYLIPNARKLKKQEFIQALLDLAAPIKEQKLKEAIVTLELMGEFDISAEFVKDCYLRGIKPDQVSQIITEKLAAGNYTATTIAKTKMKQVRNILDTLDCQIEGTEVREWSKELYTFIKDFAAKYHKEVNAEYRDKVEQIGTPETILHIKGNKIINWATDIINWAFDQEDLKKGWHKVSFALALTSGRRMDEIHGTTQYKVLDENTLEATGLSKKPEDNYKHNSPCLVNANKWVAVLNKLPENKRNQINCVVNGTIRPAIRDSVSLIWEEFGLNSYKDARDFYVAYLIATVHNKSIHGSEINYAKKLLGHEAKKQTMSYEKMVIELD